MIDYLKAQFSEFDRSDFSPRPKLSSAINIFVGWAVPAAVVVTLTRLRGRFASVEYLDTAISEGIGPHLWNVIGAIGMVIFGAFVLAPRIRWLAVAANNILVNTYAIGALMFGILSGQWANAFASANLDRWQAWANAIGFGFLFVLVLLLNSSVWYVGYLSEPSRLNTGFAAKLSSVDFRVRAVLGALVGITPICFLMLER